MCRVELRTASNLNGDLRAVGFGAAAILEGEGRSQAGYRVREFVDPHHLEEHLAIEMPVPTAPPLEGATPAARRDDVAGSKEMLRDMEKVSVH